MLRRGLWVCAATLLGLVALASVASAETNINFLLGAKSVDSEDWRLGSGQGALAILTTFGPERWPVQIAIDLLGSGTTEDSFRFSTPDLEVRGRSINESTAELDLGARKVWRRRRMRPFVGGGVAFVFGGQERLSRPGIPPSGIVFDVPVLVQEDDDQGTGLWIDGGVFWRLTRHFNLGFEARYSAAQIELFGDDVEAGGFSGGLLLGFGFGQQKGATATAAPR